MKEAVFGGGSNLPQKQRIDNLTRTGTHMLFLGLADSLFDLSADETFETLADDLHTDFFEEDDTISLITGAFDYLGVSESLQDDMLSDDEEVAKASLREISEIAIDKFENDTTESFANILQDSFLEDWKTFLRKGHSEGEKRKVAGGENHELVKSHVGKTPTFTSVPVDGKGRKPRGKSPTRVRKKGVPKWKKVQAKGWASDKKKEKKGDTREDSLTVFATDEVEVLADDVLDNMSSSDRVEYIETLSDSLGGVFGEDEELTLSDIIDDDFYMDAKRKKRKKSDCNHKQNLVRICSAKKGGCSMACKVKPEYAGKIKRGTSPLKGKKRSKSDIAKQQKSQEFRSKLGY